MGKGDRNRGKRHDAGVRRNFGLLRRRGDEGPCGLCGTVGPLSRTHVPPQCAGNDHGVQRHYLQTVTKGGLKTQLVNTRRTDGGLCVYGLCSRCNTLAGTWDLAYKEFAGALRSCWATGAIIVPGDRIRLPYAEFSPSAVARSILMGLLGVNHVLRERFPEFASGLLAGTEGLQLPPRLGLRLALARGTLGRLTGPTHSMKVLGTQSGTIEYLLSDAAVYFPPLAWQLVGDGSTYLDAQGWGDATAWLSIPLKERRQIGALCSSLPLVREPSQDPRESDAFVHLMSDAITPIVECSGLLLD